VRCLAVLSVLALAACGSGSRDVPPAAPGLSLPPVSSAPRTPTPSAAGLALGADWTTYHGDATRSGYVAGPDPREPAVAWQATLDGKVYASPLVVGGTVVAATEGGSLYGLDGRTGAVRWRRHLADPVPGKALPCGNIDPLGITGTPVYDPATGLVFAVAAQAGVRHVLYGVDVRTGAVRLSRDVDVDGMTPATHLQRAALLLAGSTVYVAYGGNFGDCGQYLGRVVGVPTSGNGGLTSFAVPTTREAGIWAPSGPALTPGGEVLVTTGNGEARGGDWDRSDSVLRLSAGLELRDGFAPEGWAQENSVDADLGSTGPLLLPGGTQALAAGKGGSVYLVDVAHLGGVGGQRDALRGCSSYGGGAVAPVNGGGAVAFLPCSGGLLQVRIAEGRLARGWQAPSSVSGSPVVVGTTVWSVQQDGALYGLDAATGAERAQVAVGDATRFATPAVSGGALFVPTLRGVTAVALVG
jgi:outer membrane protein assembly factor BamB